MVDLRRMPGHIAKLLAAGLIWLLTACYSPAAPTSRLTPPPTPTGVPCSDQLPQSECDALFELIGRVVPAPCKKVEHVSCFWGHITRVDFRWAHAYGYHITGIPASIKDLPFLTELRLFGNYELAGSIPPELFTLKKLEILDVGDTQLSGEIPVELASLTNLRYVNLYMNELTGTIPPELGKLTGLEYLHLFGNQLTGKIPPEMGSLTNLRELHLGHNQLTGSIPPELGNLSRLQKLYLHDNQLSGTIPPALGKLGWLEDLYLRQNQLTGTVPTEFNRLNHLVRLDISFNSIEGDVPDNLSSTVRVFWYHHTQLAEKVTTFWPKPGPFRSAVVHAENFDCAHGANLPRKECEALRAVYLPLDENSRYYFSFYGVYGKFPGAELDSPRLFDDRYRIDFPVFVAPEPCDWFTVDCEDDHVEGFRLGYGPIPKSYQLPPEVVNLTHVEYMVIEGDTPVCYPPESAVARWLKTLQNHPPSLVRPCE